MGSGQIRRNEAIFWTALGACILFLGWRIKVGTFRAPGPGFFALVAGLALIVIGTSMLFSKAVAKSETEGDSDADRVSLISGFLKWRLAATMGLLVAYGLFLNAAGYLLCTFLVMCGLFYDWGKNRLLNAALASLATTAVTYLIFQTWLRTQLPRGILPWW
jgi:hypothetical protein